MKYYIPTPMWKLNGDIAHEQKQLDAAMRRIAKIESYPIHRHKAKELKVWKDAVEFDLRDIAMLKDDHFAKNRAIDEEFREYLRLNHAN